MSDDLQSCVGLSCTSYVRYIVATLLKVVNGRVRIVEIE